ncbi:DUF5050 domain-containing protein [Bythopirellula polymerisocia]|uniref:Low-density lipoprotein receptor repeat class B n=1 Tax=Bythopirellula polymerisocia TaxID=2528003 RepID=A0A5C6CBG3_9BACT|nr:DUF5050 domain-containing protein [Bythopirellula polymerisocia]TWU20771.1 Low-density lipoprotein receptor repeat class B [Bythopirellula polymerisocia]
MFQKLFKRRPTGLSRRAHAGYQDTYSNRSRRLSLESLESRQMLSHSPIEFNPPGQSGNGEDDGAHALPHGVTVSQQTHWINGEPFTVVTTFIAPEAGADGGTNAGATAGALHPLSSLPQLHSNPSATVKLYLDFDGDVEPNWGSGVTTPVFDFDGDPTTFSDSELQSILVAWSKVAEDYAPFNIDVTTVEPLELADGVPESAANGIAQRIAIGGVGDGWGGGTGVAAIDSFTNSAANTAFVSLNAGPVWVGEIASHEAGHAFGLLHQSDYDQNGVKVNEYAVGTATWAPIMGTVYRSVTTWHNGTNSAGPTAFQDDMAVLARSANGFGFRADDHGDSLATATAMSYDGLTFSGAGLIGSNSDVDVWSLSISTADTYRFKVDPAEIGPNLDAVLEVWDAAGSIIAMASPALSQAAELALPLLPGNYFAAVTKTAAYGWLGAYTVSVVAPPAGVTTSPTETLLVPERGAASFTVSLDTQPTADVIVPLSVSDPGQATLSTASLTFTSANWNVPQTVSVSGVDDDAIDGDVSFSVTVGAVSSTDTEYSGLDPADVAAVSTDHGYGGFLYWTDRDSDLIQRSPLTGGPTETLVDIKALGGISGETQLRGLAVDQAGGRMYWADQSTGLIQRANLNGSNVETVLSGFAGGALMGIEVDSVDGKLYWADSSTQKIQRANLDGSGVQDLVTQQSALNLALDRAAGKMYWGDTNQGVIRRANLDGTGVEVVWTGSGTANPRGISLDPTAGKLFWYDFSVRQILRANLDGTGVETVIDLPELSQSSVLWTNVDSRAGKLYWADHGAGTIYRCNLDGSQLTKIVNGLRSPQETSIVAPSLTVVPSTGLLTSESGDFATFQVVLTTPPKSNVTIPISSSNSLEGNTTVSNLVFTPANWSVRQTVTIVGVDDTVGDGNQPYTIVLGPAVSADPDYAVIDPADVSVTNIDNEVKFRVANDASPDLTYLYAGDGTPRGTDSLDSADSAPRGIASTSAGDKSWVIDANRHVYVYDGSGALLGSWAAGTLANNAQPEGIASDGTDVWIVDNRSDTVFRYAGAANRLSGTQTAASSFKLNSGNTTPKDIVTDGQSLWVVNDATTDKVFKYALTGGLLGSWTIDAANKTPTGITLDPSGPSDIWIVDSASDQVYQYGNAASRTSGSQAAAATFALASGNANPQGISSVVGSTTSTAAADLTLSSSAVSTSVEGDLVTFNLSVTNNGPQSATNVVLTDTLDGNWVYNSASVSQGTIQQSGGVVTINVGDLAVGQTVTATVSTQALEPGNATNSAAVTASTLDGDLSNNAAVNTVSVASAPIVVTGPVTLSGKKLSNVTAATFTHASGVHPANYYRATINWGDGTTSNGSISQSGTTYSVKGSHTYSSNGNHTVSTTVTRVSGSAAPLDSDNLVQAVVAPPVSVEKLSSVAALTNNISLMPTTSTKLAESNQLIDTTVSPSTRSHTSGPLLTTASSHQFSRKAVDRVLADFHVRDSLDDGLYLMLATERSLALKF